MRKSVPIWLQLALLAVLLVAGAALWQVRAPVGAAIAQFMGAPAEKAAGKARILIASHRSSDGFLSLLKYVVV